MANGQVANSQVASDDNQKTVTWAREVLMRAVKRKRKK